MQHKVNLEITKAELKGFVKNINLLLQVMATSVPECDAIEYVNMMELRNRFKLALKRKE